MHQFRDMTDTSNILVPVLNRKTEVATESMPHIISIDDKHLSAVIEEPLFESSGQGAFAGARESREPIAGCCMTVLMLALFQSHLTLEPDDVTASFHGVTLYHNETCVIHYIVIKSNHDREDLLSGRIN